MAGYYFGSGLSETTTLDLLKAMARAGIRAVGLTPVLFSLFDRVAADVGPLHWLVQHCGHLTQRNSAIAMPHNIVLSFLPGEARYKQAAKIRNDPSHISELIPLGQFRDGLMPGRLLYGQRP